MDTDTRSIIIFFISLPFTYCLMRSFLYKTMKMIFGDEELYSNPRYLPVTRLNAALKIFPPMSYDAPERLEWDSKSWRYFLVFVLFVITITIVRRAFIVV